MVHDSTRETVPQYRAFISYSHADAAFAGWLHRKLEAAKDADGNRLTPIFIDRAELAAGPDLTAQVRAALVGSAALIVISSPAARVSHWVGQEIELFRELHSESPVYAALIEGEPNEAFPQSLLVRDGQPVEPLAADFRKGQDGRRLGLLKIVAGLTGQPLDRLVQRDAQSRQRRVMAVTAAALLLSLILSALLVVALRARSEAERQRAEAEGLVEFMLTDLRDRLKGVGRLDVMDAVNQRAMRRYANAKLEDLPKDELLRRVKLLQAMAEDDLSTLGRTVDGRAKATEAQRITADLLRRFPADPEVILAHSKSEYWLGYSYFNDSQMPRPQRRTQVAQHWGSNRDLTEQLLRTDSGNLEWKLEASYSEGNLCALEMSEPAQPALAMPYCARATALLESAHRDRPDDLDTALNLATSYAWQADAAQSAGQSKTALELRNLQVVLSDQLGRQFPSNKRVDEARFLARFGLAKLLSQLGERQRAMRELAIAKQIMLALKAADPRNADWSSWLAQADRLSDTLLNQP